MHTIRAACRFVAGVSAACGAVYLFVVVVLSVYQTAKAIQAPNVIPMDGYILGGLFGFAIALVVVATDWPKVLGEMDHAEVEKKTREEPQQDAAE